MCRTPDPNAAIAAPEAKPGRDVHDKPLSICKEASGVDIA
jgi:hypothetical protein